MRRNPLLLSSLAALLLTGAVLAQSPVLLPSSATAAAGNTFDNASWGNYTPAGATGLRMQIAYAASSFAARGIGSRIQITGVRFRSGSSGGTGGVQIGSFGIACSTARLPAAAITTDYAYNHGPDEQTVFYGALSVQATASQGQWYVNIPFQQPFAYDPTQGDLLFDLSYLFSTLTHNPAGSTAHFGDAMLGGGGLVYGPYNSQFATNTYLGVPIVELTYTVPANAASVVVRGTGCGNLDATVHQHFGAGTHDLSGPSTAATLQLAAVRNGASYRLTRTTGGFATLNSTTWLTLGDDACSTPITMPFAFPYSTKDGTPASTQQIVVASNGFVWLDGTQTSSDYSPSLGELCSQAPRIAVHWLDLAPNLGGTITYGTTAGGSAFHIQWTAVPEYNHTQNLVTAQLTLHANGDFELDYGPTNPFGTAYVGWSPGLGANQAAAIDLSAANQYGFGFDARALEAVAQSRPVLGSNQVVRIDNIRPGTVLGVMCVGLSPAVVDLAVVGMPGCTRWSTWDVTHLLLPNGAPSVTWQLGVPNNAAFVGLPLYEQAAMFSAGFNPLGIVTSNALLATIGSS